MRLWLKDSERRPDPEPVKTDDRKAMLVGLALWVVALGTLLIVFATRGADDHGWWIGTCVVGLGLGVVGLAYTHLHRS